MVFYNLFYLLILQDICAKEYDESLPEDIVRMGHKFRNTLTKMINPNPSDRPLLIDTIEAIFEIISYFEKFNANPICHSIHMMLRQNHAVEEIGLSLERVHLEESPVKDEALTGPSVKESISLQATSKRPRT